MITYISRRLIQGVVILVLVTFFIFLVMRLLPGDPLLLFISQNDVGSASPEQLAALHHQYGLDRNLMVQYFAWIGGVLKGNLGTSMFYQQDVSYLIGKALPVTMQLGIMSVIISSMLGIVFGVVCALRRGKWLDTLLTLLANLGITLPSFWLGILLIYFFALKLAWLPVWGYTSPFDDFWLSMKQSIMPVFCLILYPIASLTRQTRSSMLEITRQDYIRTAWSKGLRERIIVIRHTIKNALIPVITMLGMQVSIIFGGTVIIETVFNIPGMGRLMAQAVFGHDYQIVQSGVLIVAMVVVLANIIVDISYGWFDPRIRYN
jgi:peptide/nickel transport system permease protein